MALSLVGSVGAATAGAGNTAVTPAFGASENRSAGNYIVLWVAGMFTNTLPVTPPGYSVLVQRAGTSSSATIFITLAGGGDPAPTIPAASGTAWACQLAEFTGFTGSPYSLVDQSASATGTTTPIAATAATVDGAIGDLILMCAGVRTAATNAVTSSHTLNNGTPNTTSNDATSTPNHYNFGWVVGTANAAADSDSFACTTTLTGMSLAIASIPVAGVLLNVPAPTQSTRARVLGRGVRDPGEMTRFMMRRPALAVASGPVANQQTLSAVLSFAGAGPRTAIGKLLAATLSFTGARTIALVKALVAAVLSFTGALTSGKQLLKALSGVLSFTGAITRQTGKGLSGTLTFTGAQARAIRSGLSGALTFTGARTVKVTKTLTAAVLSLTGAITRQTGKGVSGALSFTGAQRRAIGTHLTAVLTFTGTIGKRIGKGLAAALTTVGALVTQGGQLILTPLITPPTLASIIAYVSTAAIKAYGSAAALSAYTSTSSINAYFSDSDLRDYTAAPAIVASTSKATLVTYTSTSKFGPTYG